MIGDLRQIAAYIAVLFLAALIGALYALTGAA